MTTEGILGTQCKEKSKGTLCCGCMVFSIGILLLCILLPLSFSSVEYYQYGLKQRRGSGSIDTSRVFSRGRYHIGPGYKMYKYQADAHHERFEELDVFSAGVSNNSIGLEFRIDVDFTFFLIKDEVGQLHRELANSYEDVILSRAKDAIKNEAIFVTFENYFQNRVQVEQRFREAVQRRWNDSPSLHVTLDQFHLGRIRIPESVAEIQLESRVQNERNDRERFSQEAELEREKTAVEVNKIELEKEKILKTARAEADLVVSDAKTEADQIMDNAQTEGTALLMETVGLETQEEVMAFMYIRSLHGREELDLDVSHFDAESILRTRPA